MVREITGLVAGDIREDRRLILDARSCSLILASSPAVNSPGEESEGKKKRKITFFVFYDWRGGRDEFKYRTLFVDIIFHAIRIFYSVNRLFLYVFPNSPSSSKKEGPLFQSFFLPLLFLVLLLVLQRVPQSVIDVRFSPARICRRCPRARHSG